MRRRGARCARPPTRSAGPPELQAVALCPERSGRCRPPYSGTAVVRDEIIDRYPVIADLLGVVSERLTDDLMQELNGRVDIDGEDPADVVYDWLKSESLVA